jgi:hypothetical protein
VLSARLDVVANSAGVSSVSPGAQQSTQQQAAASAEAALIAGTEPGVVARSSTTTVSPGVFEVSLAPLNARLHIQAPASPSASTNDKTPTFKSIPPNGLPYDSSPPPSNGYTVYLIMKVDQSKCGGGTSKSVMPVASLVP